MCNRRDTTLAQVHELMLQARQMLPLPEPEHVMLPGVRGSFAIHTSVHGGL